MKIIQRELEQLVLKERETSTESPKILKGILCQLSKPATHACMDQKCQKKPFVCEDEQCSCQKDHQNCLKIKNSSLIKNIQSKKVSVQSLESCINQKIQQMINLLSKFRDETLKKMKEDFQFFGLNNNQKQFLKQVNHAKPDKISGKRIWDLIISSKQQRSHIFQAVQQTLQQLQNNFNQSRQIYSLTLKKVLHDIENCDQIIQKTFKTTQIANFLKQDQHLIDHQIQFFRSKVLTSLNEIQTLQSFFGQKRLKSAKLIYRASDNNFQSNRFHMKCDGIKNTLVLVQNEYCKKIGGYTPVGWKSHFDGVYEKDESMQSFLFSLTNCDKFQLSKNQKAVKHYSDYGPVFGGHDLGICHKANQRSNSWSKINHAYKNENYCQKDKQSWNRFCGNPNSYNFAIKQWQVWSLQFV